MRVESRFSLEAVSKTSRRGDSPILLRGLRKSGQSPADLKLPLSGPLALVADRGIRRWMCQISQAIEGRRRVAIENVKPSRRLRPFCHQAHRRATRSSVTADVLGRRPRRRPRGAADAQLRRHGWREWPMASLGNDAWQGEFTVDEVGRYEYTVARLGRRVRDLAPRSAKTDRSRPGRADRPGDWRRAGRPRPPSEPTATMRARLRQWQARLASRPTEPSSHRAAAARAGRTDGPASRSSTGRRSAIRRCAVVVDRERARFSTWYELFPRSCASEAGRHGTFRDCHRLAAAAGRDGFRRALPAADSSDRRRHFARARTTPCVPRPATSARPGRSARSEGGHKAIHPQLGTLDDLHELVAAAREQGIDVALDIAFQCSPDHPYVNEHPAVVSPAARMARFNTPRTRPRSTRTFTRSISRRPTGGRCGRN